MKHQTVQRKDSGTVVQERRLEEYRRILSVNPECQKAADRCIKKHDRPEEKEYLLVWAPALIEYVNWVIKDAAGKGIKRLYFLSRDAYPMYLVAAKLTEQLGIDIDCRYIKVSRYSLRIPEYHLLGEKCLDRIFISGIDVSFRKILRRAKLTDTEIEEICKEINYTEEIDNVLNRKEILDLKEQFRKKSSLIFKYIDRHSKEAYQNCLGYLKQEGMLEEISWAVVDSGWVGTIQKSIQNILATEAVGIRVRGYYFGLYEMPDDITNCTYTAYYFEPKWKIKRKMNFSNCLYEVIYTEAVPMIKGYEKCGEEYRPVYSKTQNPNRKEIQKNTELLLELLEEYLSRGSLELNRFQPICEKLYRRVMGDPTKWEARYYGGFLFSDDICDENIKKTANELTQKEIKDLGVISKLLIMTGISKKVIHESAWIEGSIVNLDKNIKANLRRAKRAKYLTYLRQSVKAMKHR